MPSIFPSQAWLDEIKEKLNSDTKYGQVARNWEGAICFPLDVSSPLGEPTIIYLDLWHGKCRSAEFIKQLGELKPAYILTATYENLTKVLKGELDPMQAMMTRKLKVEGSMAYMMRNIPTVLDFVRCAREVTSDILS